MHALLRRQLQRLGLSDAEMPSLEVWRQHLERVEQTYQEADQDRYTLERSLSISSEEMRHLNDELRRSSETQLATEHAKLEKMLAVLRATQDAAQDGILVVDERQTMFSANRRFAEMWSILP